MERKLEPKPNFYRADYTRIRRNLEEVKWEEVLVDNFKESYEIFLGRLTESLEGNVQNCTKQQRKMYT